jgi:hypothetical protein
VTVELLEGKKMTAERDYFDRWSATIRSECGELSDAEFADLMRSVWVNHRLRQEQADSEADGAPDDFSDCGRYAFRFSLAYQRHIYRHILRRYNSALVRGLVYQLMGMCWLQEYATLMLPQVTLPTARRTFATLKRDKVRLIARLQSAIRSMP